MVLPGPVRWQAVSPGQDSPGSRLQDNIRGVEYQHPGRRPAEEGWSGTETGWRTATDPGRRSNSDLLIKIIIVRNIVMIIINLIVKITMARRISRNLSDLSQAVLD